MKKIICMMSAVLMLMAFSACADKDNGGNASPTDISATSPSDIEIPEATPIPDPQPVSELSICGIPIVSGSQLTGVGYRGATYEDGVLTLDGVDMLADYGSMNGIYFVGELNIIIKGENTLTVTNGASAIVGGTAADGSVSNLAISGDGSLKVTTDAAFGLSCSGAVTINGGTLDISGAEAAVGGGAGKLTLGDGCAVTKDTGTQVVVGAAR